MRRTRGVRRFWKFGAAWCVALVWSIAGCALIPGTGDAEAFGRVREEIARAAVADFLLVSDMLDAPLVASTEEVYSGLYLVGPVIVEAKAFGSFLADFPIGVDDVDNVMRRLGYKTLEGWRELGPTEMRSDWIKDGGWSYTLVLSTDGDWLLATLSKGLHVWGEAEAHNLAEEEAPFPIPMDGSTEDVVAAKAAVVEALGTPPGQVKAALAAQGSYRRADLVTSRDGDSVTVEATVRSTTCGEGGVEGTGRLKGFTLVQIESSLGATPLASRGGTVLVGCVYSPDKPGRVVFRLARPIRLGAEPPDGLLGTEEVRLG